MQAVIDSSYFGNFSFQLQLKMRISKGKHYRVVQQEVEADPCPFVKPSHLGRFFSSFIFLNVFQSLLQSTYKDVR